MKKINCLPTETSTVSITFNSQQMFKIFLPLPKVQKFLNRKHLTNFMLGNFKDKIRK